jgi:hypothetical protein
MCWGAAAKQRSLPHAGQPLAVMALLASAGLAAWQERTMYWGQRVISGEWNPMYGLTGFALVFLARLNGLY